jgi:endonuclease/exonuclease/phosphatase (EEP) superfamily protein YafD
MRRIVGFLTGLLLVGLVAMTVARFLGTGLRTLVLVASFSCYSLVGFLVVLVGCLLAFRGARRRRLVALAALVATVGLMVQGLAVAPFFTGTTGRADLTVMTSNLEFGRADAAAVVRTVASEGVDVLALEEVTPEELDRLLGAGLGQLLPHRLGVPSYTAAGTMVFSHYELELTADLPIRNGGLDVRVAAPTPYRLLAIHTAQPVGWTTPWTRDMATIRERAAQAVRSGPTMVMGDFNATRDHVQFRAILGTGLRDAAEQAGSGWQPTWPTRYRRSWLRPVIAIDHVLVSDRFQAMSTHTVELVGTDHRALMARVGDRNRD